MSQNFNDKKRLLEALEYIDEGLVSDTLSRVRPEAIAPKSNSAPKKHFSGVRQVALIAACALLLGAAIPMVNYVLPMLGVAIGGNAGAGNTEIDVSNESESQVLETEPLNDHGSEGIRYMINEDGVTASMIGWGECKDETARVASVYEGLPVTKMIFIESLQHQTVWLDEERWETITPDHFTFPEIKHVVIPDSIEYVDAGVINQCDYMETLHIGAGVTEIYSPIFFNEERGRNFSKITVDPENQYFTEKGNCLIRIADKRLMCAFADSVIPNDGSIVEIGPLAFYNKPGLTSVVIPEGVVELGSSAFASNQDLVRVSLPSTLKKMNGSFGCDSVTEFKYAGTVAQWHELIKESGSLWTMHTPLTHVTCSDGVVELEFDKLQHVIVDN